ncbi:DUF2269 family protein [Paenibacillus sepulcri]
MKLLLFMHLIGCVLFLGNIITAAFWKVRADVKGDAAMIHQTAKNVMLADYAFTLPGLVLIVVSGIMMAVKSDYAMWGMSWLTASLILFVITGILWAAVLLPLQRGMIRLSAEAVSGGGVSQAYRRMSAYWAVFGTLATLAPVVILFFMISKPF